MTRPATAHALIDELATPLSPAELALGGRALSRFLCRACRGTGKRRPSPRTVTSGRGGVSTGAALMVTCGTCKGTGQRGGL